MITMSVSSKIYRACQLDMLAGHYGLTPISSNRRGHWFTGPESAWRSLADDVKYRSCGQFTDGKLSPSDSLNKRIDAQKSTDSL